MKKQNTQHVSEALNLWVETLKMKRKVGETRLINSWESVVGSYIASKTSVIYIKERKLFVKIDSSVVRNELMLAKMLLIKRLNESVGNELIDDIVLK